MKTRFRPYVGALLALALAAPAVLLPVSPVGAADSINAISLQLEQEFNGAAAGPDATIVIKALLQEADPDDIFGTEPGVPATFTSAIEVDFDIESIYGDGRIDTSSPDGTCTVIAGASSCTVTFSSGDRTGTSLIRAWIDRDKKDGDEGGITEADAVEGRKAKGADDTAPYGNDCVGIDAESASCEAGPEEPGDGGTGSEPDQTDVGTIGFFPTSVPTLTCVEVASGRRGSSTLPVTVGQGEDVTWRCTAKGAGGGPVANLEVDGEMILPNGTNGGPNDPDQADADGAPTPDYDSNTNSDPRVPDAGCLTDASGVCTIVTPGQVGSRAAELGTSRLCFWGDTDQVKVGNTVTTNGNSVYNPAGGASDGGQCDLAAASVTSLTTTNFVAWQEAVGLDAPAETQTVAKGDDVTVRANIFTRTGAPSLGFPKAKVYAEVFSGSAIDIDGNTPSTPDYTFPTPKDAEAFTTLSFPANIAGTITLCVWTAQTPTMGGRSGGTEANAPSCTGKAGAESTSDATNDNGTPSPALDNTDVVVRTVTDPNPPVERTSGYWLVDSSGNVAARAADNLGSGGLTPTTKAVAIAPRGQTGYWIAGADGSVAAKGTAVNYGNAATIPLQAPIVGMAARPQGDGYWLLGRDGGIFSFGTGAKFFGSTGNLVLNQPVVGIGVTPTGEGYYLVAADGGIFTFGDAVFAGSMGATPLNKPVVGMTVPPTGGYLLVASDGGIFAFGGARFYGSTGGIVLQKPIAGLTSRADGNGYWMGAADGGVFAFNAPFHGSAVGGTTPFVGIASFGSA